MPIPLLSDVYTLARALLGDDQISTGEVFTNTILLPYFSIAYREMWRAMTNIGNPRVHRVVYYVLPANTTVLVPSTANITDIAEPEVVEERGAFTTFAITNATINSSVPSVTFTVASTTGLANGNFVTISGNMGITGTDGFWGIANVTGTTFDCLGMVSTGSYVSGGQAVSGTDQWVEVVYNATLMDNAFNTGSIRSTLGEYLWYEDMFHFPPCNSSRQLRITYNADGTPPTNSTVSVGVEDSLNYLGTRTAALAAAARGNIQEASMLNALALGSSQNPSMREGYLADFLNPMVKALQNMPPTFRRKPPYRSPRSTTPTIW